MQYCSTRSNQLHGVSSAVAIRQGIAPDGGLYTPEDIPRLEAEELRAMLNYTYQELALNILAKYLSDYPWADLERMVRAAYAYPEKFSHPKIAPVVQLGEGRYLLELWHGPTSAFKDMALQLLPYLLTAAGQLSVKAGLSATEVVILVATSGDTGKAALEGFRDVPGTRILVFYPEDGVSEIQKMQMVTQEGYNTDVIAVKGNFDDAQTGVKRIFGDSRIAAALAARDMVFSSANSINWGRLAPQIVYYFYGYLEMCRQGRIQLGQTVNVCVPTGNFGNILAAYFCKEMGLPIQTLICASNSNHVLTDFIRNGVYDRNRRFFTTVSPSMDILISSNLERLLYYLSDRDCQAVSDWLDQLITAGRYEVNEATRARVKAVFQAGFADESRTAAEIKRVYQQSKMVIDPHTAVGVAVYEDYRRETGDATPALIVSTASPFKFNSSVLRAIQGEGAIQGSNEFDLLEQLAALSGLEIPRGLCNLNQKTIRHRSVCDKEAMDREIESILKL